MKKRVRKDPETRRNELISAAETVFAKKGVENTAVSDIVKQAGVAQGTFYLYFETKRDVMNALVDRMIDGVVAHIEGAMVSNSEGAVARFRGLFDTFMAIAEQPGSEELTAAYHTEENREVHEAMARRMMPRLATIVEAIIRQGVEEGVFLVEDVTLATWFVLGGISSLEEGLADRGDLPGFLDQAVDFALGALGYRAAERG